MNRKSLEWWFDPSAFTFSSLCCLIQRLNLNISFFESPQHSLAQLWTKVKAGSILPMACYTPKEYDAGSHESEIKAFCNDSAAMMMADPEAQIVIMDLAMFGDGGFWMERVVTPMFMVLALEVRLWGGGRA